MCLSAGTRTALAEVQPYSPSTTHKQSRVRNTSRNVDIIVYRALIAILITHLVTAHGLDPFPQEFLA